MKLRRTPKNGANNEVPLEREGLENPGQAFPSRGLEDTAADARNVTRQGTEHPGPREPITQQRLAELAHRILTDIEAWSRQYGYTNVPPIEILRQVTQIAETVGQAQSRAKGQA